MLRETAVGFEFTTTNRSLIHPREDRQTTYLNMNTHRQKTQVAKPAAGPGKPYPGVCADACGQTNFDGRFGMKTCFQHRGQRFPSAGNFSHRDVGQARATRGP